MKLSLKILSLLLLFASCKKPSGNYSLEGETTDASSGAALPYVTTVFEQKSLVNGVFTNYFLEAANATSDVNGKYKMEWKKENLTEARLMVSREFYYSQEIAIAPDDLRNEVNLTKNVALWPESSVLVHLQNNSGASLIQFNWVGTNFNCNCCTNAVKTFNNLSDTVFQCDVYGGRWLKYNCAISSTSGTSFILDSLFCQPFQTNNLILNL
jgi:hypothetical protein